MFLGTRRTTEGTKECPGRVWSKCLSIYKRLLTVFKQLFFSKYNICRAYTAEEFYDYAKALAYLKPPQGNRILFITTSGGAAILATDQAEQEGLDVAPLPQEAVEAMCPVIDGILAEAA